MYENLVFKKIYCGNLQENYKKCLKFEQRSTLPCNHVGVVSVDDVIDYVSVFCEGNDVTDMGMGSVSTFVNLTWFCDWTKTRTSLREKKTKQTGITYVVVFYFCFVFYFVSGAVFHLNKRIFWQFSNCIHYFSFSQTLNCLSFFIFVNLSICIYFVFNCTLSPLLL